MKLKLVATSASPTLETNGEIYTEANLLTGPPEVSDVIAADGKASHFTLDKGTYVYAFAIEDGMGTVTVSVKTADDTSTLASDTFDTKDGYYGNNLKFEVK